MIYRKYENRCENRCGNKCENSKPDCDVAYYQCNNSKNDHKKCDCYIEKTYDLIEALEHKNEKLEDTLEKAQTNQGLANTKIDDVSNDLADIGNDLADIGTQLAKLANDLLAAQSDLADAIGKVNEAIPYQTEAIEAIDDAIKQQEHIEGIIECLEDSFKDTVKCLKGCGSNSCPILIPINSDCNEHCDKGYDC